MKNIKLPEPKLKGKISVEEAISKRRSIREFDSKPVPLEAISQILWAAQGITKGGAIYTLRSVPSAGALYPIEIFAILSDGAYHYAPEEHVLEEVLKGDVKAELTNAALKQEFVGEAPLVLVITGVFERTSVKYGERGARYVFAEAGHVSQNIYLQCEALGLATVVVGAFHDGKVQGVLNIPKDHKPIYIMPIGYKR